MCGVHRSVWHGVHRPSLTLQHRSHLYARDPRHSDSRSVSSSGRAVRPVRSGFVLRWRGVAVTLLHPRSVLAHSLARSLLRSCTTHRRPRVGTCTVTSRREACTIISRRVD